MAIALKHSTRFVDREVQVVIPKPDQAMDSDLGAEPENQPNSRKLQTADAVEQILYRQIV
jgi:hypothetical protein